MFLTLVICILGARTNLANDYGEVQHSTRAVCMYTRFSIKLIQHPFLPRASRRIGSTAFYGRRRRKVDKISYVVTSFIRSPEPSCQGTISTILPPFIR
jgi:hypothetical protein